MALELVGLVSKASGRVEADSDCHDDIVMAMSCCTYVRKYDPPLLIDTSVATLIQQEFTNILELNDDISLTEFSNAKVMKHIKRRLNGDDLLTDEQGVVDVLSLYGMG